MSANVIHAHSAFAPARTGGVTRTGPGGANGPALLWCLVAIGAVGTVMGITGTMILAQLQDFATVEVRGIHPALFQRLVFGGLAVAAVGVAGLWLRGRNVSSN